MENEKLLKKLRSRLHAIRCGPDKLKPQHEKPCLQDFRPGPAEKGYVATVNGLNIEISDVGSTEIVLSTVAKAALFSHMHIMLACPCNIDPLTHNFYIVKLGVTHVYIFFLISALKHRSWILVRTASARRF